MISVTPAFTAALRGSHEIVVAATLVNPAYTGPAAPTDFSASSLFEVVTGSVTLDTTATIRGTADLTIVAPWPTGTGQTSIAPYTSQVVIWRGVRYGNDTTEYVQLGMFRIVAVEQANLLGGQLRLTLRDRMSAQDEAKLEVPVIYATGAGWTWGTVLADLMAGGSPEPVTITWDDTVLRDTAITAQVGASGNDRVGTAATMLAGLPAGGKIFFFDHQGALQVMTAPNPLTASPVFTVDAGSNGVLLGGNRVLSRDGVINAVVVTSDAPGTSGVPFFGVAEDNTGGPTDVSVFGRCPVFRQYPVLNSNASAVAAAQTVLNQNIGVPYTITLTGIPNPALEPNDVITVVLPDPQISGSSPATEQHIIDSITIPLDFSGVMSINTRKQNL